MKHQLIGLLLFFLSLECLAQSDFKSGFVITNQNDTIYGLLNYRGDMFNATHCVFKKDLSAPRITYSPFEIKAYRFLNSKFYVSKTVKIDNVSKQLFLEYLVDGIVELYCYRDSLSNDHFFLEKEPGNIIELEKKVTTVYQDGETFEHVNNKYIGQVKYLFGDAPGLLPKLDNLVLAKKPMIKATKTYHEQVCKDGKCITYEKTLFKPKLSFGPLAGISYSTLKYKNQIHQWDFILNFTSFSPSLGLFANLLFDEKISVRYDLLFNKKRFETSSVDVRSSYTKYTYSTEFELPSLYNNVNFTYLFTTQKCSPTVGFGFYYDYHFQQPDFTVNRIMENSYVSYKTQDQIQDNFLTQAVGLSCSLGLNYQISKKHTLSIQLLYLTQLNTFRNQQCKRENLGNIILNAGLSLF